MARWIIRYGWDESRDDISAPDEALALADATQRCRDEGIEEDGIEDYASARPYTVDRAIEVGLIEADDERDWRQVQADIFRSGAAWRW
jgi:hypothetical protein